MSVKKYSSHLLVIPEDDANHDIVTGFRNHLSVKAGKIQVENVAGGWLKAIDKFADDHVMLMRKYAQRYVLILIDFDGNEDRIGYASGKIPEDLRERVFVMGSKVTPEKLSANLGMSKEKIGEALAEECLMGGTKVWLSEMLAHNQSELQRMQKSICPDLLDS
jgi:hypothetical protein